MNHNLRDSIGWQLLSIVFGCYLFITVVVTVTQLYLEYSDVESDLIVELHNTAKSFEDGLGVSLWTLDLDNLASTLKGINKIDAIAGVKVVTYDGIEEGDLLAGSGILPTKEEKDNASSTLTIDNRVINVVDVVSAQSGQANSVHRLYEYKLVIAHQEGYDTDLNDVGILYLYADKSTVINRFQTSFFLIIINAVIKTAALWIIFLFFAKRLLSRPMHHLTQATVRLTADEQCDKETLEKIGELSQSQKKNELQQLSSDFLRMRSSILDKIDTLNALNRFAITLTQAKNERQVYNKVGELLTKVFDFRDICVVEKKEIVWQAETTLPKYHHFPNNCKEVQPNLDFLRGQKQIACEHFTISEEGEPSQHVSLMYIPLAGSLNKLREIISLGVIKPERLNPSMHLNKDSYSLLNVITNMIDATLIRMMQKSVIEEQNRFLEERVTARTQALEKANEELRFAALHDPLTKLPNRALFHNRLMHLIEMAKRENRIFSVLSIDLKNFKTINDTYGHDAGDEVLVEVSRRFSSAMRKSDTLARMGGDEYCAILVEEHNKHGYDAVVNRMLMTLEEMVDLNSGESISVDANIGVSLYPEHADSVRALLKFADIAMYHAKRNDSGFNLFNLKDSDIETERIKLGFDLEKADERNEFFIEYQPIVDIKSQKLLSLEALVRWNHPEKGVIYPEKFIYLAEQNNNIRNVTFWVVKNVCKQMVKWNDMGFNLKVAINLSSRVFAAKETPKLLENTVLEHGVKPEQICLDISESATSLKPERAIDIINHLNKIGFSISLDNFGIGHSSLSYLSQIKATDIKIDRNFFLSDFQKNRPMIEAIISLAHLLNMKVIAEGVANREILDFMLEKRCDYMQGFHIHAPASADTIEAWYKSCLKRGNYLPKRDSNDSVDQQAS